MPGHMTLWKMSNFQEFRRNHTKTDEIVKQKPLILGLKFLSIFFFLLKNGQNTVEGA